MLHSLREWGALLGLVFFLGAGLVYYNYNDPNAGATKIRNAAVLACQRGVAKAFIVEDFMNQAATARRNSAVFEAANGEMIQAQNDVAAAKHYEQDAVKYVNLTPTDCQAIYPAP